MMKPCSCGSGHNRYARYDARGIFCAYVCDKCEVKRLEGFRHEIFTDSNYQTDEAIEPEDY